MVFYKEIMKTITQNAVALFAAAIVAGAVTALGQDNGAQIQSQDWTGNNDFTNKIVIPTPEYLTNSQASASAIQQYRVQQQGDIIKPAATMQAGPRIEQRPPTTVMQNDPWIQQDHLWDITPDVEPSTSPGHKE
jgi:hypothetical protein